MKKIVFGSILSAVTLAFFAGCSSKAVKVDNLGTDHSPVVLKSVDDFPKPSTSMDEIRRTGYVRVIEESAKDQDEFEALTAARGLAVRKALSIADGSRVAAESMINNGSLAKDQVHLLVEGHIKTYDCGAYYNKGLRVGYYCVEVPVR